MLLTFDAPSGNVTCTRRLRSNTPLQSLTLANDQAFFECARAPGRRSVLADEPTDDFARAELRLPPLPLPRADLRRVPDARRTWSREEQPASPDDPPAAWTRICRVLLNLDETITRE